jgi:hypothetical protein
MLDGLAIPWYAVRYGLNADEVVLSSPRSWTGSYVPPDRAE